MARMKRREFLITTAGAAVLAGARLRAAAPDLKLLINEATSMNRPFREFVEGSARAGFRYLEPWVHKIDEFAARESLPAARRLLASARVTTVCACAQGEIVEPLPDADQARGLDQLKHKIEVCAELGIPRLNVHSLGRERYKAADYDWGAERWVRACELAKASGLRLVLEFIRATAYMSSLPTALEILHKANHPNGGLTIDLWHLWGGPSKFEDLELLRAGEPEHVHINDAPAGLPREILTDRDRMAPGQGSIPVAKIIRFLLAEKKYRGAFSVESFDPKYQNADVYETALIMKNASEKLFNTI